MFVSRHFLLRFNVIALKNFKFSSHMHPPQTACPACLLWQRHQGEGQTYCLVGQDSISVLQTYCSQCLAHFPWRSQQSRINKCGSNLKRRPSCRCWAWMRACRGSQGA